VGVGVAVFTGRKAEPPGRRALATAALRQAVKMSGADEAHRYFVGFRAWEK
jgi:hypothetical protein